MLHTPAQIPCRVVGLEEDPHAWGRQTRVTLAGTAPLVEFEAELTLPAGAPSPQLGTTAVVTVAFTDAAALSVDEARAIAGLPDEAGA